MKAGQENETNRPETKLTFNLSKSCLYCGEPLKVKDFCSKHHKKAYYQQLAKQQETTEFFNWYTDFRDSFIGKHLLQENKDLSKSRDCES